MVWASMNQAVLVQARMNVIAATRFNMRRAPWICFIEQQVLYRPKRKSETGRSIRFPRLSKGGHGRIPIATHSVARTLVSAASTRLDALPVRASADTSRNCRPHATLKATMENETIGLAVQAVGRTGVLHQLTGVIARHDGDISTVEILSNRPEEARTYFEVILPGSTEELLEDLRNLPIVRHVELVKTFQTIYGKRVIIAGGGAQVGQVAMGAISEADRHNIRGEHI